MAEAGNTTARVGQKAPEFDVPAYYQGKFLTVKLADFHGKWLMRIRVLCWYCNQSEA